MSDLNEFLMNRWKRMSDKCKFLIKRADEIAEWAKAVVDPPSDLIRRKAGESEVRALAYLMNSDADPKSMDRYKRTPMMMAADGGHIDTVRLLLERGARLKTGRVTAR